ncbi:helix-turn-helix domain-containing protein [Thermodesulfobacteriota bacterium]
MTSKEAAKYLNVPVRYVRYLSKTGKLAHILINGRMRYYRKEHLDEYLENRTVHVENENQKHEKENNYEHSN